MSFNRLDYDTDTYKQTLKESIGPCEYQLGTPQTSCDPCFSKDPRVRIQKNGISLNNRIRNMDISSELLNITRDLSNASVNKYKPNNNIPANNELLKYIECSNMNTEDTRLSNPPSTLRGTGWNRWEWLCQDPQKNIIEPFYNPVQTKLVACDNHRPSVPIPLQQDLVHPSPINNPIETVLVSSLQVPTGPPSVQWRDAEEIRNY